MIALLRYYSSYYLRSFKGIPPLSLFVLAVAVNYAYTPNPILDSYAFTSLLLFFVMGWVTMTVLHIEDARQQQITLLHAGNPRTYYAAHFLLCMAIGLFLSVFAVVYPIVFNGFGVKTTFVHIVLGILSHLSLAMLSTALSAWFTREWVANKANTWWGILSVLIFSVAIASVKSKLLVWQLLLWLLPPVHLCLKIMGADDGLAKIPLVFILQFGWIMLYSLLGILAFLIAVRHRHTMR